MGKIITRFLRFQNRGLGHESGPVVGETLAYDAWRRPDLRCLLSAPAQPQRPPWPPQRPQHLPPPPPARGPGLTSPRRGSASDSSLGAPSPTTPLRMRGALLPRPGSRSVSFPLLWRSVRVALFLPVRPPSFGEEDGRGRGKRGEVGERARRPSAVVSWLRAAVAASLQLLQQRRRWRKGWSASGSPRRSCEGSWPLWLRRPGAEVSRTAQLLGRACPPRLPLLLCLLPARSVALRSPRPFPQQWGRGPEGGPPGSPTSPGACVESRSGSSGPFRRSPTRVPASAPFLPAEVPVPPLPPSSQTSSWIPSRQETRKEWRWGQAPGRIVPKRNHPQARHLGKLRKVE